MKTLITFFLLFAGLNLFAQSQDSLELDNLCHKCLEEARLPRPDTLDCYPVVTKMCLEKIKITYNKLYDRLEGGERKKIAREQLRWEEARNVEFDQYDLIIADKSRPLPERRYAVKQERKIAESRAMYLLKTLNNLTHKEHKE